MCYVLTMAGIVDHIKNEWPVLTAAPVSFAILSVLALLTGFAGGKAWSDREISILERQLELKEGEVDELKRIVERIDTIERSLHSLRYFPQPLEILPDPIVPNFKGERVFRP